MCQRLADLGAAAVMPMGSLIGSGMGVANPAEPRADLPRAPVPVIVDAGIGTASDAVIAMELGASACCSTPRSPRRRSGAAWRARCGTRSRPAGTPTLPAASRAAGAPSRRARSSASSARERAARCRRLCRHRPSPGGGAARDNRRRGRTRGRALGAGCATRPAAAERRELAARLARRRGARRPPSVGADVELAAADRRRRRASAAGDRDRGGARAARADALIGVSAHGEAGRRWAAAAGADYVTLSPIFFDRQQARLRAGARRRRCAQLRRYGLPVLALGGITAARPTPVSPPAPPASP